jgi:uncharacterized protein YndB with AHSA1/START domain
MARHSVEIRRPIEDVFAVLTDVTLTGRWYPAKVEEWWTTSPPHGVGSVRRARVMLMGRVVENDAVVTEHQPPRRAAMQGLASNAPFEVTSSFEPIEGGTRVDVDSIFHLHGLMRLIGPLFIGRYEREWDLGLANLKRMMEAGGALSRCTARRRRSGAHARDYDEHTQLMPCFQNNPSSSTSTRSAAPSSIPAQPGTGRSAGANEAKWR